MSKFLTHSKDITVWGESEHQLAVEDTFSVIRCPLPGRVQEILSVTWGAKQRRNLHENAMLFLSSQWHSSQLETVWWECLLEVRWWYFKWGRTGNRVNDKKTQKQKRILIFSRSHTILSPSSSPQTESPTCAAFQRLSLSSCWLSSLCFKRCQKAPPKEVDILTILGI